MPRSSHIYIILVAHNLYPVNFTISISSNKIHSTLNRYIYTLWIDISTLSRNIYFPNLVFADRAYSSKHASEQNT